MKQNRSVQQQGFYNLTKCNEAQFVQTCWSFNIIQSLLKVPDSFYHLSTKNRVATLSRPEQHSPHFPALITFKIIYMVICWRRLILHSAASFQQTQMLRASQYSISMANVQMGSRL